jgi:hypothetical protein
MLVATFEVQDQSVQVHYQTDGKVGSFTLMDTAPTKVANCIIGGDFETTGMLIDQESRRAFRIRITSSDPAHAWFDVL